MKQPIAVAAEPGVIGQALQSLVPGSGPALVVENGVVYLVAWESAQPIPSDTAIAQAVQALPAQQQAAQQAQATLRQQVLATAQTAVGVNVTALTTAQLRAIVALLLWKQGAISTDGTIQPLGQWV